MTHITINEHLDSMTKEKPEPWLVDLAQMLQELGNMDHALAASLAFDLSRNLRAAQGLRGLIQGYLVTKEELTEGNLTSIQDNSIRMTIQRLSSNLHDLAILNSQSSTFKTKEK